MRKSWSLIAAVGVFMSVSTAYAETVTYKVSGTYDAANASGIFVPSSSSGTFTVTISYVVPSFPDLTVSNSQRVFAQYIGGLRIPTFSVDADGHTFSSIGGASEIDVTDGKVTGENDSVVIKQSGVTDAASGNIGMTSNLQLTGDSTAFSGITIPNLVAANLTGTFSESLSNGARFSGTVTSIALVLPAAPAAVPAPAALGGGATLLALAGLRRRR